MKSMRRRFPPRPTVERLRQVLKVNAKGDLVYATTRTYIYHGANQRAGSRRFGPYGFTVQVDGARLLVDRVKQALQSGRWPDADIGETPCRIQMTPPQTM
jgi:hypothetical protein